MRCRFLLVLVIITTLVLIRCHSLVEVVVVATAAGTTARTTTLHTNPTHARTYVSTKQATTNYYCWHGSERVTNSRIEGANKFAVSGNLELGECARSASPQAAKFEIEIHLKFKKTPNEMAGRFLPG